ncbi:MAG: putative toxin-antitoxin system toxin component, PIN family [Armatimonadetes bacterium]|nr:putative toxin-antitoxin system toxin component, PIN family [Armatimonadota bacterium]
MQPDRVFLDTNVLLSGLIFSGNEATLLQLALEGSIHLVLADVVLEEARAVLLDKFPSHSDILDRYLELIEYERVPLPDDATVAQAYLVCRDADDCVVAASAAISQPDVVLTGDKDLLTEEVRNWLPVSRCAEYLRKLSLG